MLLCLGLVYRFQGMNRLEVVQALNNTCFVDGFCRIQKELADITLDPPPNCR